MIKVIDLKDELIKDRLNYIINKAAEYEDGETGLDLCIKMYCEDEGINEEVCEAAQRLAHRQGALEAGIPLSVINGNKKLTDLFSKDYINFKIKGE